ncbi:MAG: hypothetical protein QME92_12310 [Bacillota bacterium]|nr:hypothetical protein [Bacillota bacterium]
MSAVSGSAPGRRTGGGIGGGTGSSGLEAGRRAVVVIVANSPGEISGWARPVVARLRASETGTAPALGGLVVVVVVPPCAFASGHETEVAAAIPGVDAVVGPSEYVKYALFGVVPKGFRQAQVAGTPDGGRGIVVHLGGDPMHSALLARRLGYPAVLYSDRTAGFVGSFARFMVEDARVEAKLRRKGVPGEKISIVGNLMIDGVTADLERDAARAALGVGAGAPLVCLMPGSRRQQIRYAMPFFLRVAEIVRKFRDEAAFVAVLSPYVSPSMVGAAVRRAGARREAPEGRHLGHAGKRLEGAGGRLVQASGSAPPSPGSESALSESVEMLPTPSCQRAPLGAPSPSATPRALQPLENPEESVNPRLEPAHAFVIETDEGVAVRLVDRDRYDAMAASDVAVAMPGTVTAELAFLGVPTVVAVPMNIPEEVPLPGLPGLLGGIPVIGRHLKRAAVQKAIERIEFTAIPNKRQRRMITPEVRGVLTAQDVAIKVLELLQDAKARGRIAVELRQAMGQPGASDRVAEMVLETLVSTGGRRR